MRPEILFPLFSAVTRLKGVGPRIGKLIEGLAGPHIADLLWHLPSGLIDRRFSPKLAEAPDGVICTVTVEIVDHIAGRSKRQPYRVVCQDDTALIELIFFHAKADWLAKQLPIGSTRVLSGKIEHFGGKLQMPHPDHIVPPEEAESVRTVEPVYPLTGGLILKTLGKTIGQALEQAPELSEWGNEPLVKQRGWPTWRAALEAAHHPANAEDIEPLAPARQRLAYDELLANQLALALVRAHQKRRKGRRIEGNGDKRALVKAALPFELTGSQVQTLGEIFADMADDTRMLRLLQGDVGSGKTVVALMAMLNAVETGRQTALMAPTEILARQHFETIGPLAEAAGIRLAVLTGRDKGKARGAILEELASGTIDIVVGTHALFQEDVVFRDLAMAVIDEQHRFGVHQRVMLGEKGPDRDKGGIDTLVMTATPIPRTLTMTAYGDLDVSRLTEKPAGRKPIETSTIPLSRLDDVIAGVTRRLEGGARVYWVCPLVEESEVLEDVAAAEERHAHLRKVLGDRVGLVHGRMAGPEKDAVMEDFKQGRITVLVATTVIEVGVDVPQATVMVIEHAERYGLAQLHQLRGRIGRGAEASYCLLLYGSPLSETAHDRLTIMRETEDGFRIAEEDLRLRGAGEVLGTRQSGLPTFRMADPVLHSDILAAARDDARMMVDKDPDLKSPRGEALRVLLYLFERDAAIRYLRSG
ncbi:MAG: ATP-dependent DNA helicase RecG [Rhodospirillaceae bacterium]|nr:ATP-dependent DNA helicase RecG [Rhodospirillaceae bacterium]